MTVIMQLIIIDNNTLKANLVNLLKKSELDNIGKKVYG